jgi:hypothetical protein
MTDFLEIPFVAALIIAIFACGAGVIIGWAWPLRSGMPEAEPDHETTIEQRARKAHD